MSILLTITAIIMKQFNNKLSIFIPRVSSKWANSSKIIERFKLYDIGVVERVDLVMKNDINSEPYYHAFIHFYKWYDTPATRNLQDRINDPKRQAYFIHDDPNYWVLLKNKNPMSEIEVKMERRIDALETKYNNLKTVELRHLDRIMYLETKMIEMKTQMNYWTDPELYKWRTSADYSVSTNEIYPLWCHPVNETNEEQPIWNTNLESLENGMTMSDYVEQTAKYQNNVYEENNNYLDMNDYDMNDYDILD